MKQIILVRHGEAENNLNNLVGGWSDVELTDLGIKQAQAVADRFSEELKGSYMVYSSDLARAKQTAEIICKKLGKKPIYAKALREHNPGIVSGMAREEADKHFQDFSPPTLDWRPYPESESLGEFYKRVKTFMDKLIETEERVLIVSHGGTIQHIISWWLGVPNTDIYKVAFDIRNASVTILDNGEYDQKRIERLNDTTHYARIGLKHSI
jgi:probable phosphoglycerate mutase